MPVLPSETLTVSTMIPDSNAWKRHPQIGILEKQIQVNQAQISVEKAARLPDLMIGYFNQSLIGTYEINGERVSYSAARRFQGMQAGISMPIWQKPIAKKIEAAKQQTFVAESKLAAEMLQRKAKFSALQTEYSEQLKSLVQFQRETLTQAEQLQTIA